MKERKRSTHKHAWSEPFMHHDRDPHGYQTQYVAKRCTSCGQIRVLVGKELTEGFRQIAAKDPS